MSKVSLQPCSGYELQNLKDNLEKLLAPLGGVGLLCKSGDRVLLKPNLLSGAEPEACITTNPNIVRAVAEMVLDAGGKPFIADSPPSSGFDKLATITGMNEVAKQLGIPIRHLNDPIEKRLGEDKLFQVLELSQQALEADKIINLAKLKTHAMMLMTMSVKNMFGCVVGLRKARWHMAAGENKLYFAKLMVQIYETMSPALSIVDGISAMEGDGPGRAGTPVDVNLLAASADGVALDRVLLEVAGVNPESLYTNVAAKEMGVGETDLSKIEVVGTALADVTKVKMKMPKGVGVVPLPKIARHLLNRFLTPRPLEDEKTCTLCGECSDICPVEVITVGDKRLSIDYDHCIRCYCCVEVCPEGSIKPYEPMLAKMLAR